MLAITAVAGAKAVPTLALEPVAGVCTRVPVVALVVEPVVVAFAPLVLLPLTTEATALFTTKLAFALPSSEMISMACLSSASNFVKLSASVTFVLPAFMLKLA